MGGSQFPSLTALWQELPPTVTRPKLWTLHTAAELAFVTGMILFWGFFG